jgi:lysozyme family protein
MKDRSIKINAVDAAGASGQDDAKVKATRTPRTAFDNMLNLNMKEMSMQPIVFKKNLFDPNIQLIPPQPAYSANDHAFWGSLGVVMKNEGAGYVKNDAMRGPAKMGILQSTARNFGYKGDIKNLTQAEAVNIYGQLWARSGAANLPYPLNTVHFDTYVNSPTAADKILKQSGGDVNSYLDIREQRYERLAALRPDRFGTYLDGWMNRIENLRNIADQYARVVEAQKAKAADKSGDKTT